MRIVFLSHSPMGGSFVVGSHQLAKALARMGHDVIHVSAAISIAHLATVLTRRSARQRFRRWLRGGDRVDGVTDIVPLTLLPWQLARVSSSTIQGYSRLMFESPLRIFGSRHLKSADWLIVDDPRFAGLVGQYNAGHLVYRATDLYSLMRRDNSLADAERMICARANLLVATSEPVAEHLRNLCGRPVHVITNGVDFEHFAASHSSNWQVKFNLPGNREDRAIYVGAFDQRFGTEVLRAAVRAMPTKYFLLVGPGSQVVAEAFKEPNIVALGIVEYALLPQVLRACAVGLLPLSDDPSNAGRSPMKFYEYAAAGLCIAATSTSELRRRKLATLFLGTAADSFVRAVREAFDCVADVAKVEAARTAARLEGWSGKATELLSLGGP